MAQAATKELALEAIAPSPTNPRRTMDEAALAELAESVREHGVLQPVLARPTEDGGYELVFGHRRLEAARRAGLKTIPAMVREMGDREVLEAQLLENRDREDVSPVEEADGLLRLREEFGLEVEEIATRLGRSHKHIYQRLQLCGLPSVAREALAEGRLLLGVALLIARVPDATLRDAAAEDLVVDAGDEPISIAHARYQIEARFARRLDKAPFNVADAALCKKAGACTKCPKRTGNQRELFDDISSDDVCTDPPCFAKKVDLEWDRRVKEAKKAGRRVLQGEEVKEAFPVGGILPTYHFCDLDAPWYEGAEPGMNLRGQLGDRADELAILVRDGEGRIRTLARRDEVQDLLGKAREAKLSPKDRAELEADRRKGEEEQARRELKAKVREEAEHRILEAMETRPESARLWWALALAIAGEWSGDEALLEALHRRELAADSESWGDASPKKLRDLLAKLPGATLRGVVCEVLLGHIESELEFEAIASIYDVNLARLEEELAPKPKPTPKQKRAAKAKSHASASVVED